jgi:hypothetical protein
VIYICIPALNEARTIGVLLWKIRQVMDEFPRDYHVLVLDDGSTDDTREVLEPYLRVLPVTVLRNERTQGYAASQERLLREAVHRSTHPKRDGVVTLQADFTESPDDIPLLLKRLEGGADIVGVTVTATEGELPRAVRWSRRGLPWLLSGAPLPKEVGDPLTGFRAYRVSVLRRALQDHEGRPMLTKHGWAVNAELLVAVLPHVRRAEGAEVRLRYTRRERPTRFRPWSTALELWDVARKAPRRLAQARAAAAAADARPAPGGPAPQRPPPPQHAAPAPQRSQHEAPSGRRQSQHGGSPDRPRPQQGGEADRPRQPQPDRPRHAQPTASGAAPSHGGQRPARSDGPRREQRHAQPAPAAVAPEDVTTETQPPAPTKPKRRRSSRRKAGAGKEAAAASASAEVGSAEAPVVEAPSAEVAPAEAPVASGESGDAPAPRKRSPRPRRPRRPRQAGSPPAAGGDGGEVGGGTGNGDGE